MTHRFISLIAALSLYLALSAQQTEAPFGLRFEATADGECCVAKSPDASGKIVVPATAVIENERLRVTSVSAEAFAGNSALEAVELPDGVTRIGRKAFYDCRSLTTVVLGAATSDMATQCFDRCTALRRINCRAQTPPATGTYTFDASVYGNASLTVPERRRDAYEASSTWGRFENIVENNLFGDDVTFTLSLPSGTVATRERYGSAVALALIPDEGWMLYSVCFNGNNVTDDVADDGLLTTPRLTADSRLNVVFARSANLTDIAAERPSVTVDGTALIVGGGADSVKVFSLDGVMLYDGPAGRIDAGRRGPVIVVIGPYVFKLCL